MNCKNCGHLEFCRIDENSQIKTHSGIGYSINDQRKSTKCFLCPTGKRCLKFEVTQ